MQNDVYNCLFILRQIEHNIIIIPVASYRSTTVDVLGGRNHRCGSHT